jgi:hypothetical protein
MKRERGEREREGEERVRERERERQRERNKKIGDRRKTRQKAAGWSRIDACNKVE